MASSITESLDDLHIDNPTTSKTNGFHRSSSVDPVPNGSLHNGDAGTVEELQAELRHTREENERLEGQYRALLDRLSEMKTKIGHKLQEDAEELERREHTIQSLTAQTEDLNLTIDTLNSELVATNSDLDRTSRELHALRSRALDESAHESNLLQRELHELRSELEECRLERDEWERAVLEERVAVENARAESANLRRDLELERQVREREAELCAREKERAANLQSVLEDFQTTQDRDIQSIKTSFTQKVNTLEQSLAGFKVRALNAEVELQDATNSTRRVVELEKEIKDKTVTNDKLRHEVVTLNEHLMEALRRLRRNAADTSVDRRLITNVLLQFITTPRADPKRFEMLGLMASILQWSDQERELAGLQRVVTVGGGARGKRRVAEEKFEESESFSQMWVEFLLKEASQGSTRFSAAPHSPGGTSPTIALPSLPSASSASSTGGGTPTESRFKLPSLALGRAGMMAMNSGTPSIASSTTHTRKGSSGSQGGL